jgi:hypothetical protein
MDRELVNAVAGQVYAALGRVPSYGQDFKRDKSPEAQTAYETARAILELVEAYYSPPG